MHKLTCVWDEEYVFTYDKKYQFEIAKSFYLYLINPQVTIKKPIECFQTFFCNKVENLCAIRDKQIADDAKVKYKEKRTYISVKDIYGTEDLDSIDSYELSDYYKSYWGLD